jgi:hypothetical protein
VTAHQHLGHPATIRPAERAALRAAYPQAQVHTFAGSGHAGSLARRRDYVAAIRAFLDGA